MFDLCSTETIVLKHRFTGAEMSFNIDQLEADYNKDGPVPLFRAHGDLFIESNWSETHVCLASKQDKLLWHHKSDTCLCPIFPPITF